MPDFINDAHRTIFADTEHIAGWQEPGDSQALFELGYKHGDVLLEVGTYAGRSAACMIAGARSAGRRPKFYGVDIASSALEMTKATLAARGLMSMCILFCGTLERFVARFPIQPTGVFIDGGHSYSDVAADIAVLRRILKPGTPVIFHDYLNTDTPGVKQAVDEAASHGLITIQGTAAGSALTTATKLCEARSTSPSTAAFYLPKLMDGIREQSRAVADRISKSLTRS
jgi:predicted O-methyltransferase YrrM